MNPVRIKQLSKLKILDRSLYSRKKFRFLSGGRGSGKSWGIARQLVSYATQFNVFIVCGRAIQKNLKESAYKLVVDTIRALGLLDDFVILIDEIRHKITGARFIFIGLEGNPEGIKSLESAHILWIEEADKVKQNTWDLLIPTMRAAGWEIWASWNPQLPSDPVERVWESNAYRGVRVHTTYLDNPELDADKVEEAERMKIEDYEKYCHVYLGHFRPEGDNTVIPLKHIISAQERPIVRSKMPKIASLDPALYGGDTAGFAIRQGDSIISLLEWSKQDAPELERKTANECMKEDVDFLVIDADGLGLPILQHMKKDYPNLTIIAHNGNGASPDQAYANARSYVWHKTRDELKTRLAIPNNRKLSDELQRQTYKHNADGQVLLTSKEEMRKQGIPSPNLADAVTMTYSPKLLKAIKSATIAKQPVIEYEQPMLY